MTDISVRVVLSHIYRRIIYRFTVYSYYTVTRNTAIYTTRVIFTVRHGRARYIRYAFFLSANSSVSRL